MEIKNFWLLILWLNFNQLLGCIAQPPEGSSSSSSSSSSSGPIEIGRPAEAYRSKEYIPYSQGGGISQEQLTYLKKTFASGQTYAAILKLRQQGVLGSPNETSETEEVYEILGTGDGVRPNQKFRIRYERSPKCDYKCTEGFWD